MTQGELVAWSLLNPLLARADLGFLLTQAGIPLLLEFHRGLGLVGRLQRRLFVDLHVHKAEVLVLTLGGLSLFVRLSLLAVLAFFRLYLAWLGPVADDALIIGGR